MRMIEAALIVRVAVVVSSGSRGKQLPLHQ
jgi:hypothetical protein